MCPRACAPACALAPARLRVPSRLPGCVAAWLRGCTPPRPLPSPFSPLSSPLSPLSSLHLSSALVCLCAARISRLSRRAQKGSLGLWQSARLDVCPAGALHLFRRDEHDMICIQLAGSSRVLLMAADQPGLAPYPSDHPCADTSALQAATASDGGGGGGGGGGEGIGAEGGLRGKAAAAVLRAGDAIFVPNHWWHQTRTGGAAPPAAPTISSAASGASAASAASARSAAAVEPACITLVLQFVNVDAIDLHLLPAPPAPLPPHALAQVARAVEELLRGATPRAADERAVFDECARLLEGSGGGSSCGSSCGSSGGSNGGSSGGSSGDGGGCGGGGGSSGGDSSGATKEETTTFLARRNFVLRALSRAFGRDGARAFWASFFDARRWAALRMSATTAPRLDSAAAAAAAAAATVRPIGDSATDGKGRVVYADLDVPGSPPAATATTPSSAPTPAEALVALRAVLAPTAPSVERLGTLKVTGRGKRILYEIREGSTDAEREASRHQPSELIAVFGDWLRALLAESAPFAEMLRGLLRRRRDDQGDEGGRGGGGHGDGGGVHDEVLLLGAHWIVPKVDAADGGVQPAQAMHTDILDKGEVLAVAVHAYGAHMGTLFDPLGTVFERSDAVLRADSSAFVYDSGGLHCGPGRAQVAGPYPAYEVGRVFFMLASPSLPAASVAAHQANNYLLARPETIELGGLVQ